jgi:hypothetical protein
MPREDLKPSGRPESLRGSDHTMEPERTEMVSETLSIVMDLRGIE